ncbi:hypothetical protein [Spiroplasma poulsonii]|nr:hypothetical protein [Spiroplasma poulsonii]UNF62066.1 hypothetical protein MNU24_00955 [Spiroplasma poulsonii]
MKTFWWGSAKKRRGFSNRLIKGENICSTVTVTLKEQMFGKQLNLI